MVKNTRYYKPSGGYSKAFFWYCLLLLAVDIPVLSVGYVYLEHYINIVQLNFLITASCGVAIGGIMYYMVKSCKVRNPAIVLVCIVIAVCVFEYIQLCIFVSLIFNISPFELLFSPGTVFEGMSKIYEKGTWCIGKRCHISRDNVSGIILLIVWIMEFIIIASCAIVLPLLKSKSPFSEMADSWYAKMNSQIKIDMPENFDDLKNNMENGNFTELIRLVKEKKAIGRCFLRLALYEPPLSEEPYYLVLERITLDERNKVKKAKTLVKYLSIDKQSAMEIIQTVPLIPNSSSIFKRILQKFQK